MQQSTCIKLSPAKGTLCCKAKEDRVGRISKQVPVSGADRKSGEGPDGSSRDAEVRLDVRAGRGYMPVRHTTQPTNVASVRCGKGSRAPVASKAAQQIERNAPRYAWLCCHCTSCMNHEPPCPPCNPRDKRHGLTKKKQLSTPG